MEHTLRARRVGAYGHNTRARGRRHVWVVTLAQENLLHFYVLGHVGAQEKFFASGFDHGVQAAAHVLAAARTNPVSGSGMC